MNREYSNIGDLQRDQSDPGEGLEFFVLRDRFPLKAIHTYSSVVAWWCAEFSRLAYVLNTDRIIKEANDAGFEIELFYNDDTEAHIAWNDDVIVIFFRGTQTDSIGDILTDLDFFLDKSDSHGQVHRGFRDSLNEVWPEMIKLINKLDDGNRSMIFTGHSLGAALATLAAARVNHRSIVYTFGSPRCGGPAFAFMFDAENDHFRFVNDRDIVPMLPPSFIGYRHTGTPHNVDYREAIKYVGNFKNAPTKWIILRIARIARLWLRTTIAAIFLAVRQAVIEHITDHNMINYSKYLEDHLRELDK